jgi:ABC-2 type transport system permease protein
MNTNNSNKKRLKFFRGVREILLTGKEEYGHIFRDPGLLILFFVASLIYPPMYCSIYKSEVLTDVPVAVVDLSQTARSRELIRNLDATPDLSIAYRCTSMAEAREAFDMRKVHGIVMIPANFSDRLHQGEQAVVSMYSDMSSFLYYRAMLTACNYTVMKQGEKIQLERLGSRGITGQTATTSVSPLDYASNVLYNQGGGFASFLMPAVLILIIHQTLFFGIGMQAGTLREENRYHRLVPANRERSLFQIVSGKALSYFLMYLMLSVYILGVIPRLFGLPHIGNFMDIVWMLVPFLLATIFFSMTISVFIRNRETGLVIFLFASLILLFLSGFSWPRSNISTFWLAFADLFPSTHGIQAYIKLNTMGAGRREISQEYVSLWIQAGAYFLTTLFVYRLQISNSRKRASKELAVAEAGADPLPA